MNLDESVTEWLVTEKLQYYYVLILLTPIKYHYSG